MYCLINLLKLIVIRDVFVKMLLKHSLIIIKIQTIQSVSQIWIYFKEVNLIYIYIFYTKIFVEVLLINFDVVKSNTHHDDTQQFY